jgi:hypothetical protein
MPKRERLLTDEQLASIRAQALIDANQQLRRDPAFTCDGCSERKRCPFVYDLYNTDGDCLAEK